MLYHYMRSDFTIFPKLLTNWLSSIYLTEPFFPTDFDVTFNIQQITIHPRVCF